MINLADGTNSISELQKLAEWIKTDPRLTIGNFTTEFEKKWSEWQGCNYSVFVNSGSSANLLMYYTLICNGILQSSHDDIVIVPVVSWATTVSPLIQFGVKVILCDCNLENFGLDISHLKQLIQKYGKRIKAIVVCHVLGFPNDMDEIIEICNSENIILLEDSCESIGSTYNNIKTGNFGKISTFSFFYGHHISTIEGGMICTNDWNLYQIIKSLRAHGWDRNNDNREIMREENGIDDFHAPYTFYLPGFNLRATEIQAFLGVEQMKKIDDYITIRNYNLLYYDKNIKTKNKFLLKNNCFYSNFAYPLIVDDANMLYQKLKENEIDSRPIICGSISEQPFWKVYSNENLLLKNARMVHSNGIYLPNHQNLKEDDLKKIVNVVNEVVE